MNQGSNINGGVSTPSLRRSQSAMRSEVPRTLLTRCFVHIMWWCPRPVVVWFHCHLYPIVQRRRWQSLFRNQLYASKLVGCFVFLSCNALQANTSTKKMEGIIARKMNTFCESVKDSGTCETPTQGRIVHRHGSRRSGLWYCCEIKIFTAVLKSLRIMVRMRRWVF